MYEMFCGCRPFQAEDFLGCAGWRRAYRLGRSGERNRCTVLAHLCRPQVALAAILLVLWVFPSRGAAQTVHPVTGRHIPRVMGIPGADWLEREERVKEERPEKALTALGLRPGMMVGDVGAGTGFYTLRIAKRIVPGGIVYANDIQEGMLERLRANAAAEDVKNVRTILGTDTDAHLPARALDLVLLVDTYHEFSHPRRMLTSIKRSLKPDGQLVLLEYRKEDPTVPILPEHKMSVREVRAEVTPEGYRFEKVVDTMPWQHIIFFRRADSDGNSPIRTTKLGR
jgi:ubiquinone/menaquinone biosynthesis C-methylase UbiE